MLISKKLMLKALAAILTFSTLSCKAGVIPFADLLIWKISEQTSSIWASISTLPASNVHDDHVKNINFNWKPGVRAGFLYEPQQCYFDSRFYWTYFANDKRYLFPVENQLISPGFFSSFLSLNTFFGANLEWRIAMNMFDYNISHMFAVSDSITIRPSLGLKGGTIRQHIRVNWDADIYEATEKVKNNFSGVGPTFGVDLKCKMLRNISLVGQFSSAFMWGNWKVVDTYNRPGALDGIITPTTITTDLSNAQLGTLMLNYFLGFEWVHQGQSEIGLQLGYEMQFWPNQLRLTMFQQLPIHGDLTLQGATCRIYINL